MSTSMLRFLATALLAVVISAVTSGSVRAQLVENCACKTLTVRVNEICQKKITVCFLSAASDRCFTFEAGNKYAVECEDQMDIAIVDCNNHKQLLDPATGCIKALPIGPGCCIDACLTKLDNGCLLLDITEAPVRLCQCP